MIQTSASVWAETIPDSVAGADMAPSKEHWDASMKLVTPLSP